MVISRFRFRNFLLILLAPILMSYTAAIPAKMTVTVQPSQVYEDDPIQGIITIIHSRDQQIDASSFMMNDKPLKVTFVKEEEPGKAILGSAPDALVVSTFSFSIPPAKAGLYLIPAISASIGGISISSNQTSYEVMQIERSPNLRLEATILNKGKIYPGQDVYFQYRIYFRFPTELSREELPLLDLPQFQNKGAARVETGVDGLDTVQVITQIARAPEAGTYTIGRSLIEGHIYRQLPSGDRDYIPPLLVSDTPPIEIVVSPFPAAGRPDSFNGALGILEWRINLLSAPSVQAGDTLQLEILVSGQGDIESAKLPDIVNQPGFKGAFQVNQVPILTEMVNQTKRFVIELIPLSESIAQIPSIQFSSFDPTSEVYITKTSPPIPITVRPGGKVSQPSIPQQVNVPPISPSSVEGMTPAVTVSPIDIQGNVMIKESESSTWHMDSILLVYLAIVLAFFLGVQILFKHIISGKMRTKGGSRDLLMQAYKDKGNPDLACQMITKALLLKLYENGATKELLQMPENLSSEGLEGEIQKFLISLQQKRFQGLESQVEIKEILEEAGQFYHRLKLMKQ